MSDTVGELRRTCTRCHLERRFTVRVDLEGMPGPAPVHIARLCIGCAVDILGDLHRETLTIRHGRK